MKEKILKLRAEGKTYNQIKKELNCSKGTIAYHCGIGQKQKVKARGKKQRVEPKTRLNNILNTRYYGMTIRGPGYNKKNREILPFSLSEFKKHILQDSKCYITGRKLNLENPLTWHIDHVIPKSKGGKTELNNLKAVSKEGNRAKSDLFLPEFIELCKNILAHHGYHVSQRRTKPPRLK